MSLLKFIQCDICRRSTFPVDEAFEGRTKDLRIAAEKAGWRLGRGGGGYPQICPKCMPTQKG
jgi:hypothetical protein